MSAATDIAAPLLAIDHEESFLSWLCKDRMESGQYRTWPGTVCAIPRVLAIFALILSGLLLSALAQMIQPADMTRAEAASGVSVATGWDHTARLDWADEAWSESYISRYGSPAITINATAGVTLVLSEASLYDANAAGLTLERAIAVFLGRYGLKQC